MADSSASRPAEDDPDAVLHLSGVPDHSCRVSQEAKIKEHVDGSDFALQPISGTPDPESVTPVVPRHPKPYTEVMEMTQRGERPDGIQDINDEPISEPRMAPKPKVST